LFFRLGYWIARRPFWVIVCCLAACSFFASGLRFLRQETRPEKLWIPSDAPFVRDSQWVRANLPLLARPQLAIFEAENVLTKEALLQVYTNNFQNAEGLRISLFAILTPHDRLGFFQTKISSLKLNANL